MKYQQALLTAAGQLAKAGIEEAQADAWVLFEYCTKMDRTHYFLSQRDEMKKEEEEEFFRLIREREKRIPLQHLTGVQYFCGYPFYVNRHVLIPRHDTECLVEEALRMIKEGDAVLDMCTGSGCILLSIAKLFQKELCLKGCDLSEEALKVALRNAEELQVNASFSRGDLFDALVGEDRIYDVIVSNPPYIATGEIEGLSPEVKDHEPFSALDGKEDGLYFYRRIIREARSHLKKEGWLLFEIGYDQGESVPLIMQQEGYTDIHVRKDLAGLDRVVAGRRS